MATQKPISSLMAIIIKSLMVDHGNEAKKVEADTADIERFFVDEAAHENETTPAVPSCHGDDSPG